MAAPRKSLNNVRWRKIRRIQLQRHPLCVHCAELGKATEATQVDHIDWQQPDNHHWDNLQSLCHSCHSKKTARDRRGEREIQLDGTPVGWQ